MGTVKEDLNTSSTHEPYKYWGFISYSHRDKKWGRWLHKSLETYKVPRQLVGRETEIGKVPRKAYPVFLDREELFTSADLGANIDNALRQSRYLMIICSPSSAQSVWVNEEIKRFKAMGREDRVLSLIVEGEPNVSGKEEVAKEECFPEALRYKVDAEGRLIYEGTEPIAADVRPGQDGKKNARLKLLAGMLGIDYGVLNDREKKRRFWRRVQVGLAIIVAAGAGFGIWSFQAHRAEKERLRAEKSVYLEKIAPVSRASRK